MENKPVLGKLIIKGKIVLETGLHIGGTDTGIAIGGLDNPIVRNPLNNQPYIPGSSLKGKMRALFERIQNKKLKSIDKEGKIKRHECSDPNCEVCRLYGSVDKDGKNLPSRLIFRDSYLDEESKEMLENMETDMPYSEIKSENAINRITAQADPRNIERIPKGVKFDFEIIYTNENKDHFKEDIESLITSMRLLEDDYLGGGGSRGNGKIRFEIKEVEYRSKDFYTENKEPEKLEVDGGIEELSNKIVGIIKD